MLLTDRNFPGLEPQQLAGGQRVDHV